VTGHVAVPDARRPTLGAGEFAAGQRLGEADPDGRVSGGAGRPGAARAWLTGAPPGLSRTAGTGCSPSARPGSR
jgi:hypothetical protein